MSRASSLLPREESLLAVFKWKLEQLSATNKWYPVLSRYIGQVSGRVPGFGGDPATVPATLSYSEPALVPSGRESIQTRSRTLSMTRFGDFEKFLFRTEAGDDLVFRSREAEIERLVRYAWEKRSVVTIVVVRDHDILVPETMISGDTHFAGSRQEFARLAGSRVGCRRGSHLLATPAAGRVRSAGVHHYLTGGETDARE